MPISEFLAGVRSLVGNALLVLPSVTACVFDDQGRLLLARHNELGDVWAPPGGMVEPDEVPETAVVREIREEVGLDIEVQGLIGVYGGPQFRSVYPNGDQVSYVITAYGCTAGATTARPDGVEIAETRWVTEAEAATFRLTAWAPAVLPEVYAWWRARAETREPAGR
ncbi:NUDIX domain-containing protein [Sphaerisporangium fuscum]|uniref:NUDIX domain-containing protein n=1 Tax=Sphaerisporangium fuscum TaxID=2835868 RepID=UPI0027E22C79|nr:NUDIX domain-containing protein [Sphaerisporangium fuscum]